MILETEKTSIQNPKTSTAVEIWQKISSSHQKYWRPNDFSHLPIAAVLQTLSRLYRAGKLERVSKGIYYFPHQTRFGLSHPSLAEVQQLSTPQTLFPAGVTAANLLGFTTQNSSFGEYATSASSFPLKIAGLGVRIHTHRPGAWQNLSPIDAALLDFLRCRGQHSELSPLETKRKLLKYFQQEQHFDRLTIVAKTEPSRVRAIMGAIGQEIGSYKQSLEMLRHSLNPVSKFDFGILKCLQYSKEWQAK